MQLTFRSVKALRAGPVTGAPARRARAGFELKKGRLTVLRVEVPEEAAAACALEPAVAETGGVGGMRRESRRGETERKERGGFQLDVVVSGQKLSPTREGDTGSHVSGAWTRMWLHNA